MEGWHEFMTTLCEQKRMNQEATDREERHAAMVPAPRRGRPSLAQVTAMVQRQRDRLRPRDTPDTPDR